MHRVEKKNLCPDNFQVAVFARQIRLSRRKLFFTTPVYILFVLFTIMSIFYCIDAAATEGYKWNAAVSPFGIEDAYANFEDLDGGDVFYGNMILEDLQVGWTRNGASKYGGIYWNAVQPFETSEYSWDIASTIIRGAESNGINTMVTITPFASWDQEKCHEAGDKKLPCDLDAYRSFIIALVQQFGDVVKYWGIANEVDGGEYWTDSAANYAVLVKVTAEAIHEVDPDAKIVLSAISDSDFLKEFLVTLAEFAPDGERYFDVADMHYFRLARDWRDSGYSQKLDYKGAKKIYDRLRRIYDYFGYADVPIWMTETATYSNSPSPTDFWPYQDEELHAADLVKRIVYPLSYGVAKVFWVTAVEWSNFAERGQNNYFDNCGLIGNPKNENGYYLKSAYYTYKKLIAFLAGSEWSLTDFVEESSVDNVYVVQFNNENISRPRYVVWWDWYDEYMYMSTKRITLPVAFSGQAEVIPAVPPYTSGKEISSYQQAFAENSEIIPVIKGRISVELHRSPLLIKQADQ